jgi:hypothetical protein
MSSIEMFGSSAGNHCSVIGAEFERGKMNSEIVRLASS